VIERKVIERKVIERKVMERSEIEAMIPHRAPFLWIDRVEELEPGLRCVAVKFVDPADPIFAGHFPARPILPGVLLIEAVAQTAGVMLGSAGAPVAGEGVALLAAVNRFKFLRPVSPGQELRIETKRLTEVGKMACIGGTVWVDGEMVASGELSVVSG
jgi:3-hydroxyacyl-[acyl-carrier-protein] dehydratase